jgi:hypothetical protein
LKLTVEKPSISKPFTLELADVDPPSNGPSPTEISFALRVNKPAFVRLGDRRVPTPLFSRLIVGAVMDTLPLSEAFDHSIAAALMVKEFLAKRLMLEGSEVVPPGNRTTPWVEPSEEPPEAEMFTLLKLAKLPQKALVR